jgi:hypothetical protein
MDDTPDPEDKRNDGNSAANNANYIVGKSEIKYCASQRWGSDWQRHLEQARTHRDHQYSSAALNQEQ